MAAAAAETAAARAEGARLALETELATVKQREKEKVRFCVRAASLWQLHTAHGTPVRGSHTQHGAQPAPVAAKLRANELFWEKVSKSTQVAHRSLKPRFPASLLQELEAARLRSVSAADVAGLKSRTELLNGQKASLLSEMTAMARLLGPACFGPNIAHVAARQQMSLIKNPCSVQHPTGTVWFRIASWHWLLFNSVYSARPRLCTGCRAGQQQLLIGGLIAPQTEAHKARAAEVEQLRRELADAQAAAAAAAARPAGGTSAPLSLRSGGVGASDGGPGSNQGSMPVTPTASWAQVSVA